MRVLRPWSQDDLLLIYTINREEFVVNGFRSRNLLTYFPNLQTM